MIVEVLVLSGKKCLDQPVRDRLYGNEQPALLGVFGNERSIGGMHPRHHGRFVKRQLLEVGKILLGLPDDVSRSDGNTAEQNEPGAEQERQKS
jgi:hypothetical protein